MLQFSASEYSHVKQDSRFRAHFCGVFWLLGRGLSRMLGLIVQPKGQPFSESKNDRSDTNNPSGEWSDDFD
jgi:hypothetical protein